MEKGIEEKTYSVNDNGFLLSPFDYDKNWMQVVAREEGLAITDQHEKIVFAVRSFYLSFEEFPKINQFSAVTSQDLRTIFELFPSGLSQGVCRMAGLPQPTSFLL